MPDPETTRHLLSLLEVRRNLVIGLATGLVIAGLAYVYRVFELGGPTSATRGSPALFLLLALVLALTIGALVATVLTIRRAISIARTSDPADGEAADQH